MNLSEIITIPNIALMRHAQCITTEDTPLRPRSVEYLSESVVPAAIAHLQTAGFVKISIFHSSQSRAYLTATELEKRFDHAGFWVGVQQSHILDVNRPLNLKYLQDEQEFNPSSFAFFITHEPNITELNPDVLKEVRYLELFGNGLHIPGHEEYS